MCSLFYLVCLQKLTTDVFFTKSGTQDSVKTIDLVKFYKVWEVRLRKKD